MPTRPQRTNRSSTSWRPRASRATAASPSPPKPVRSKTGARGTAPYLLSFSPPPTQALPQMHWLERDWYRISPLHLVLWPLSLLFALGAHLRRVLFSTGLLRSIRVPVPVIVAGNISVGGT